MQRQLVRDVHVFRALQHLGIHHVSDDGLIFAGKIFVQKLRQTIACNLFFVVSRLRIQPFVFSCEVENIIAALSYSFLQQGPDPGNILEQFVGNTVSLLADIPACCRISRLCRRRPPGPTPSAQIDGDGGRSDHERCPALGASEDNHLSREHFQTALGGAAVVDPAEYCSPCACSQRFQALDGSLKTNRDC